LPRSPGLCALSVSQQAIADVDGHAQRTGHTGNLVLHENRFADAGLRMGGMECCSRKGQQDCEEENTPSPIHGSSSAAVVSRVQPSMWYICHKRRAATPPISGVRIGLRSNLRIKNSWTSRGDCLPAKAGRRFEVAYFEAVLLLRLTT
jgi:hypothetical protein